MVIQQYLNKRMGCNQKNIKAAYRHEADRSCSGSFDQHTYFTKCSLKIFLSTPNLFVDVTR